MPVLQDGRGNEKRTSNLLALGSEADEFEACVHHIVAIMNDFLGILPEYVGRSQIFL